MTTEKCDQCGNVLNSVGGYLAVVNRRGSFCSVACLEDSQEPKYLDNTCQVCGEPQLGSHYHETEET